MKKYNKIKSGKDRIQLIKRPVLSYDFTWFSKLCIN